jgi:hypothetical protein
MESNAMATSNHKTWGGMRQLWRGSGWPPGLAPLLPTYRACANLLVILLFVVVELFGDRDEIDN